MNQTIETNIITRLRDKFKLGIEISEGWKNYIFKKPEIEALSKERMKICNQCPELDEAGTHCIVPGTYPCCKLCGCAMEVKSRNPNSVCPSEENKWKDILINKKI